MTTHIQTADVSVQRTDMDDVRLEIDAIAHQLLNDPTHMTIELPISLYTELQTLARDEQCTALDVVAHLVARRIYQRRTWGEHWNALCASVQQHGGLDVPDDEEAFLEHMRTIRQDVYEEEYAHLYDHLYR